MSIVSELDHGTFESLEPGVLSLHVPTFNKAVQININRHAPSGLLNVCVVREAASGSVLVARTDKKPLQVRVNNKRPAFTSPVDEVSFTRRDTGLWEPHLTYDIHNQFTFFHFANLVAKFARQKQLKSVDLEC